MTRWLDDPIPFALHDVLEKKEVSSLCQYVAKLYVIQLKRVRQECENSREKKFPPLHDIPETKEVSSEERKSGKNLCYSKQNG
jgi:hypothetical protein